jgi:hypothetical protein
MCILEYLVEKLRPQVMQSLEKEKSKLSLVCTSKFEIAGVASEVSQGNLFPFLLLYLVTPSLQHPLVLFERDSRRN